MLYAFAIYPLSFLFFIFLVSLIIKLIMKKKDNKSLLIALGVTAALIIFCIVGFARWTQKTFSWRELTYDRNHTDVVYTLDEPVADLMENYYIRNHGWSSTDSCEHWFQTSWYESIEDLVEVMPLEDDEQIDCFVSSLDGSNVETTFKDYDLYVVPANETRDVTYYGVDYEELGFMTPRYDDPIAYYIVVDNDTSEVSLAAYYLENYRG